MSANEKKLIGEVLSGAVTPDSHPDLFDDDVVYFAVRKLESADFPWLAAELKKAPNQAGWKQVVSVLSPEHQQQVVAKA